jgi:hypothetical protein
MPPGSSGRRSQGARAVAPGDVCREVARALDWLLRVIDAMRDQHGHLGADHFPFSGNQDELFDPVERFFAAAHGAEVDFDRVLATVLFTDVVASTEAAARMGGRAWRDLIALRATGRHRIPERMTQSGGRV